MRAQPPQRPWGEVALVILETGAAASFQILAALQPDRACAALRACGRVILFEAVQYCPHLRKMAFLGRGFLFRVRRKTLLAQRPPEIRQLTGESRVLRQRTGGHHQRVVPLPAVVDPELLHGEGVPDAALIPLRAVPVASIPQRAAAGRADVATEPTVRTILVHGDPFFARGARPRADRRLAGVMPTRRMR
jgi:hypothetical protein